MDGEHLPSGLPWPSKEADDPPESGLASLVAMADMGAIVVCPHGWSPSHAFEKRGPARDRLPMVIGPRQRGAKSFFQP